MMSRNAPEKAGGQNCNNTDNNNNNNTNHDDNSSNTKPSPLFGLYNHHRFDGQNPSAAMTMTTMPQLHNHGNPIEPPPPLYSASPRSQNPGTNPTLRLSDLNTDKDSNNTNFHDKFVQEWIWQLTQNNNQNLVQQPDSVTSSSASTPQVNQDQLALANMHQHMLRLQETLSPTDSNVTFNLNINEDAMDAEVDEEPNSPAEDGSHGPGVSSKFNLDPIKRAKSEPGLSLDDIISSGIDPESLDPHVLKRIKNTESARRSRVKRQAKLKNMEVTLESQNDEISKLREVTTLLRQELHTLKGESESIKLTYYRLQTWLNSRGLRVPSEYDIRM